VEGLEKESLKRLNSFLIESADEGLDCTLPDRRLDG